MYTHIDLLLVEMILHNMLCLLADLWAYSQLLQILHLEGGSPSAWLLLRGMEHIWKEAGKGKEQLFSKNQIVYEDSQLPVSVN